MIMQFALLPSKEGDLESKGIKVYMYFYLLFTSLFREKTRGKFCPVGIYSVGSPLSSR